jgi:hypothetical protein
VNDRFLTEYFNDQNRNSATGRGPFGQSGGASSYNPAPLRNTTIVSFDQLPLAAQTTLSAQGAGTPNDRVTQGTLDGTTAYDVSTFKDGQWITLRVGADGSVLSSSSSAR